MNKFLHTVASSWTFLLTLNHDARNHEFIYIYYRLLHIAKFSLQTNNNFYSSKVLENNKSIIEFLTKRRFKPEIALACRILMSSWMVMWNFAVMTKIGTKFESPVFFSMSTGYQKADRDPHPTRSKQQVASATKRDITTCNVHLCYKCKATPLQAWTGPEGSRRLRLPDFKTIGTWKWYKVVSPTHRPPLPPGNIPGTHFC